MWHKPCRTFHPWCPCIKTRCLVRCDRQPAQKSTWCGLFGLLQSHSALPSTCARAFPWQWRRDLWLIGWPLISTDHPTREEIINEPQLMSQTSMIHSSDLFSLFHFHYDLIDWNKGSLSATKYDFQYWCAYIFKADFCWRKLDIFLLSFSPFLSPPLSLYIYVYIYVYTHIWMSCYPLEYHICLTTLCTSFRR